MKHVIYYGVRGTVAAPSTSPFHGRKMDMAGIHKIHMQIALKIIVKVQDSLLLHIRDVLLSVADSY